MKPDSEDIASNIKDLKMWFEHQKLPWHEDGNADNAKAKTCQKHKNCTLKEFCSAGGSCQVCKQCQDPSDSYNGKCPCGPGKKKNKKKKKAKANDSADAGSSNTKSCQKHKNCTLKEFCSAGGSCQVCKQCQDPSDSYNGKCPWRPGQEEKQEEGIKEGTPQKICRILARRRACRFAE